MDIVEIIVYILPAYVANGVPVVLGGGKAIDGGAKFIDGKPVFGKNKTIRGFISAIVFGTAVGIVMALLNIVPPRTFPIAAFLLSLGAMIGDLVGSFIKRRLNIAPGGYAFFDGVLFIIFALLFAFPYLPRGIFDGKNIIAIILITVFLHMFFNILANKLGWKKTPW